MRVCFAYACFSVILTCVWCASLQVLGFIQFISSFEKKKNRFYRKELHTIISAEEIKSLKDLPMTTFESRVWQNLGQKYVDRQDRQPVIIILSFLLMLLFDQNIG